TRVDIAADAVLVLVSDSRGPGGVRGRGTGQRCPADETDGVKGCGADGFGEAWTCCAAEGEPAEHAQLGAEEELGIELRINVLGWDAGEGELVTEGSGAVDLRADLQVVSGEKHA